MFTVATAVASAGVHYGSAFFNHATTVTAAAGASTQAGIAATTAALIVILVHPLSVQSRNEISWQQGAGCPAGRTANRGSAIGCAAIRTAITWLGARGRIASPFTVIDFAAATSAADEVSFDLPQGLDWT